MDRSDDTPHPGPERWRRRTELARAVFGLGVARHSLARIAFLPSHRLLDVEPTPVSSIERAIRIGRAEGLRYVYGGNIPGHPTESTACPECGEVVIERQGFALKKNSVMHGRCPLCGAEIAVHQKEGSK